MAWFKSRRTDTVRPSVPWVEMRFTISLSGLGWLCGWVMSVRFVCQNPTSRCGSSLSRHPICGLSALRPRYARPPLRSPQIGFTDRLLHRPGRGLGTIRPWNWVQFNLTEVQLTLTKVQLRLLKVQLRPTGVQLRLMEVQLNLMEVQLNLTEVQLNVTEVQLNVTEVQLSLARVQCDLQEVQSQLAEPQYDPPRSPSNL